MATRQSFPIHPVMLAIGGVLAGCVVGYFSAHYFPLFGGVAMVGRPFSPARNSLVPGHVVLCAILLGVLAWRAGKAIAKASQS